MDFDPEALMKINKLSEIEDAIADESQRLEENSTISNKQKSIVYKTQSNRASQQTPNPVNAKSGNIERINLKSG